MTSKTFACVLCCVLIELAACSKNPPTSAAAPAASPAQAQPESACDRKLITAQDVAGILSEPVVKTSDITGDAQSCKFSTAGFSSVTITVRPGHGLAAVGTYTSGKMNEYEKSEVLAGVGDAAVRSLELNRIVARKGDLLCEITGPGMAKEAGNPTTLKLAALCNKIFAAY